MVLELKVLVHQLYDRIEHQSHDMVDPGTITIKRYGLDLFFIIQNVCNKMSDHFASCDRPTNMGIITCGCVDS